MASGSDDCVQTLRYKLSQKQEFFCNGLT